MYYTLYKMNSQERFDEALVNTSGDSEYENFIYIGDNETENGKNIFMDYFPNENLGEGGKFIYHNSDYCLCGHRLPKYNHFIMNKYTKEIKIVGSTCVKKYIIDDNPKCIKCEENCHNRGLCEKHIPKCKGCSRYLGGFEGVCCGEIYQICRSCHKVKIPSCRVCNKLSCSCDPDVVDISCVDCTAFVGKKCITCVCEPLSCIDCLKKYTCSICETFDKNITKINCKTCEKEIKICEKDRYITLCKECYFIENRCMKCEKKIGINQICQICGLSGNFCIVCYVKHFSSHKCKCGNQTKKTGNCITCNGNTGKCDRCFEINKFCGICETKYMCKNCNRTKIDSKNKICKECGDFIGMICEKCSTKYCGHCIEKHKCALCSIISDNMKDAIFCYVCEKTRKLCNNCSETRICCNECNDIKLAEYKIFVMRGNKCEGCENLCSSAAYKRCLCDGKYLCMKCCDKVKNCVLFCKNCEKFGSDCSGKVCHNCWKLMT
jgi:hypothetical protein